MSWQSADGCLFSSAAQCTAPVFCRPLSARSSAALPSFGSPVSSPDPSGCGEHLPCLLLIDLSELYELLLFIV